MIAQRGADVEAAAVVDDLQGQPVRAPRSVTLQPSAPECFTAFDSASWSTRKRLMDVALGERGRHAVLAVVDLDRRGARRPRRRSCGRRRGGRGTGSSTCAAGARCPGCRVRARAGRRRGLPSRPGLPAPSGISARTRARSMVRNDIRWLTSSCSSRARRVRSCSCASISRPLRLESAARAALRSVTSMAEAM